jgi:hypothetical protein
MNAPFKPVSGTRWLNAFIIGGDLHCPLPGIPIKATIMLILLVTTALIASLVVEMFVRHFNSNYEIEWPTTTAAPENSMALEIAATLRQAAGKLNSK